MNEHMHNTIMRRVRRVYYMRKMLQPFALKLYAAIAAMFALVSLVSVPNVIVNARSISDASGLYSFTKSALLDTELAVQLTLVVGALALALLLRDLVRRHKPSMAHQFAR